MRPNVQGHADVAALRSGAPADGARSPTTFWLDMKRRLEERLALVVAAGSTVTYLDYPVYSNVGDLLIYFGSQKWMEGCNLNVLHRWNVLDFSFPDLPPKAIILCQGGGNFGDLYPGHQQLREAVISHYANHRIVILPQSIYYADPNNVVPSRRIMNSHDDLHIFCRDQESITFVEKEFPNARPHLAPDMATFLYPLRAFLRVRSKAQTLYRQGYLLRQDMESREDDERAAPGDDEWLGDWRDLIGPNFASAILNMQRVNRYGGRYIPGTGFEKVWTALMRRVVARCAARFLETERISSSRLHGYIMARLLDVPCELLDNSYGKNRRYYRDWHEATAADDLRSKSSSQDGQPGWTQSAPI